MYEREKKKRKKERKKETFGALEAAGRIAKTNTRDCASVEYSNEKR